MTPFLDGGGGDISGSSTGNEGEGVAVQVEVLDRAIYLSSVGYTVIEVILAVEESIYPRRGAGEPARFTPGASTSAPGIPTFIDLTATYLFDRSNIESEATELWAARA